MHSNKNWIKRDRWQNTYFKYNFYFVTWESNSWLQPVWNFLFLHYTLFCWTIHQCYDNPFSTRNFKTHSSVRGSTSSCCWICIFGYSFEKPCTSSFPKLWKEKISILYYTWMTHNRNNQRLVTAIIIILTLTLWPLRVDWHLISPYNITPESHINIRRKRKWSPTKEGLDYKTNSPFHHLRTCIKDSIENI